MPPVGQIGVQKIRGQLRSMSDRYYVCFTDGKVDTYGKATQSAHMTAP